MDEERFKLGLSVKIDICVSMASVFQNELLDFVLFFSSTTSFFKAPGQSNYAAGCTFKDAFAQRLSQEWLCAVKVINWGYWGSIGIVASEDYKNKMLKAGIGSIEPSEGMRALETLLSSKRDQILLMKVTKAQVLDGFNIDESMECYPEKTLSYILKLQNYNFGQDSMLNLIKSDFSSFMNEMSVLLSKLLLGQLQLIGLLNPKGTLISESKKMVSLPELYDRWLNQSFDILEQNDYLKYDDGKSRVIEQKLIDLNVVWAEWDRKKVSWMDDPNKNSQIILVETTLRALPEILTGKVQATEKIFPNSSMKLVEGVYKNNIVADFFNGVIADTVAAYINERCNNEKSPKIRILEIGAGTGGTSSLVFPKVKPYEDSIEEYCYTDLSQAFLIHAKKEYGPNNPYLTYKIFNAAEPIAGQNLDIGEYDIVIASNVLHATNNIRHTLRNAKGLLKKNGLLLLNEISGSALYTHLTFGLLEGWWLYEDPLVRIPGCPGLSSESWKKVLEWEGFKTLFYPVPEAHESGQQIIVAESDGIVMQKSVFEPEIIVTEEEQIDTVNLQVSKPERMSESLLKEKSSFYITKLIGEALHISRNKIDYSEPLERYGLDSILVVQLANEFSKVFDNINSTLFFEYPTVNELTEYFVNNHKASLLSLFGLDKEERIIESSHKQDCKVSVKEGSSESTKAAPANKRRFLGTNKEKIEIKSESTSIEDIAIIGISGRYPGANNIEEFWQNLQDGVDSIIEIPKDRWDHDLYFDEDKHKLGKSYCKWGGFLDDVDKFDPLFFNITPRDAEIMDPMDRLYLETVWSLFENAGYTRELIHEEFQSMVGVYVGAMYQQYQSFQSDIVRESLISTSSYSSIANRVSHYFNLQGPSIAIDTMCSSSAVAIHMACESLMKGECKLAVAGGVNLSIHPKKYLGLSLAQLLGSHKNSRSFSDGDGFLPAEAIGAVLLKPLSDAIRDKDSILAVIKSTTINHNGSSNGYSVPNPNAQALLLEENFKKSRINPRTISYIESAASGSPLADSIEINTLTKMFKKFTKDEQFCALGSVKSNIGHAEAASTISQLTKVVMQLQYGKLVPLIKTDSQNQNIILENSAFYLQRELEEWKRPVLDLDGVKREYPLRAAISSFGAGGSNAHLIIEEYNPSTLKPDLHIRAVTSQVIVFSARNEERLHVVIKQMYDFLGNKKNLHLSDIAYTLQVCRETMEYRLAMVVNSIDELMLGLKESLVYLREEKEIETSIPIFTGNSEGGHLEIKRLLSGKLSETIQQVLIEEKNLEKIALFWAQGGNMSWESFHEGEDVSKIALINYPFEKRRCWIENNREFQHIEELSLESQIRVADSKKSISITDQIIEIISQSMGIDAEKLNRDYELTKYGVDSIAFTSIFQHIQSQVNPLITLPGFLEMKTTQDIIDLVLSLDKDKSIQSVIPVNDIVLPTGRQFHELLHLNSTLSGRPVFWIHGGLGGVEVYKNLAQQIKRPFYGIQARGWMTESSPLNGIQAMAAYYIHVIQSVQSEGPYDLGGYSIGGILAYEITRQLQELGQDVNSIVMVDSIYCDEIKKDLSEKSKIMQTINIALISTIKKPEEAAGILLRRDEVDHTLSDIKFMNQLLKLAQKRGLTKQLTQVRSQIKQNLKVQDAYKLRDFSVMPLSSHHDINCYYFRNKSGLFFGELEPYFSSVKNELSLDNINYWEEWERQMPNLNIKEVDSSNHMMLLSEQKSFEAIASFCRGLYT